MPSENELEVYRQFRTSQDKYTYFLLAAAGTAIGFSVHRTEGMRLSWWMIPLGIGVLCWGVSFWAGCLHLQYMASSLYANIGLLKVQAGTHEHLPPNPTPLVRQIAAQGIGDAIASNSKKTAFYAWLQFRSLLAGAIFFIGWHISTLVQ